MQVLPAGQHCCLRRGRVGAWGISRRAGLLACHSSMHRAPQQALLSAGRQAGGEGEEEEEDDEEEEGAPGVPPQQFGEDEEDEEEEDDDEVTPHSPLWRPWLSRGPAVLAIDDG